MHSEKHQFNWFVPEDFYNIRTTKEMMFNHKIDGICICLSFILLHTCVFVHRSHQPDCVQTISKSCGNKLYFFMVSLAMAFVLFLFLLCAIRMFLPIMQWLSFSRSRFFFHGIFKQNARAAYTLYHIFFSLKKTFLTFFIFFSILFHSFFTLLHVLFLSHHVLPQNRMPCIYLRQFLVSEYFISSMQHRTTDC